MDPARETNPPLPAPGRPGAAPLDPGARTALIQRFHAARSPMLFLDYDGTLVNFQADASKAAPSPATRDAMTRIVARRPDSLCVISGRSRASLETWFTDPAIRLVAEHGAFLRDSRGNWTPLVDVHADWMGPVDAAMHEAQAEIPGSHLEKKELSVCWHYRAVTTPTADAVAAALDARIAAMQPAHGFDIIRGNRLLEVRAHGMSKASAAHVAREHNADFLAAIGDDTTDEDMFLALGSDAMTVRVGAAPTSARYRIPAVEDVIALVTALAEGPA